MSYWEAVSVQGVFAVLAMSVALMLWKLLPKSSHATFNGQHWKFGGAFAGFVFTWLMAHQLTQDTLAGAQRWQPKERAPATRLEIIQPPIQKQRYEELFQDLDRDSEFYAFNAPFQIEKVAGFHEDAVAVHKKRYESGVRSKYLFFYGDSYRRGTTFFDSLRKEIGEERFNNQVHFRYWQNAPLKPCNSFFVARKQNKNVLIFYPNPYKTEGLPDHVIYLEGADEIHNYYTRYFLQQWAKAVRAIAEEEVRSKLAQ